ncbi:MAG TPA: hypothetical protein VD969_21780 [Symbiobacteriaceae bacterium]|nr:hypothetical protein [Symbiobacteriaceae bacterium]
MVHRGHAQGQGHVEPGARVKLTDLQGLRQRRDGLGRAAGLFGHNTSA